MTITSYRKWLESLFLTAQRFPLARRVLETARSRRRRRRSQCGGSVEQFEQRIVLTRHIIPINEAASQNYDPYREILYIPEPTGILRRFDVSTQTFLPAWNIGVNLGAADLTPDLQYLYIVQNIPAGPNAQVYKVDLDTGAVTTLVIQSNSGGVGVFDLEIAANGFAFLTMSSSVNRLFPVYQLDVATDTLSIRSDVPGSGGNGLVTQNSFMSHSSDRTLISFGDEYSSNGRTFLYDSTTDAFTAQTNTGTFIQSQSEINRDNSLVSSSADGRYINIYDSNLQFVTSLASLGADGANSFDKYRDLFYAVNSVTNEILVIDTHTWTKLFSIPVEFDISNNPILNAFEDGKYLYHSSWDSGPVSEYDLPTLILVQNADGETSAQSTSGGNPSSGNDVPVVATDVTEGNSGTSTATITIVLSTPSSQTVTVQYATADGSAIAGEDYVATSGTLTFQPYQTTQTISVPIIGDTAAETEENFNVRLSSSQNAFLFQSLAKVQIFDNDSGIPPSVTGLAPTITFSENDLNSAAQVIDGNISFTDPDTPSLKGGHLVVAITSGGGAEDRLGIRDQGTGTGKIGVNGMTVTYGGVPFASVILNNTLNVEFTTDSATPAAIEALIDNLTYRNTSDSPTPSRTISIVVTDEFGTSSLEATTELTVTSQNDPPTISPIANRTMSEDSVLQVPFVIGDDQTAADLLVLSVTSSNQNLLPDTNAVISGTGTSRTVTLTPLPNQSGSSTVTLTVSDGTLLTTRIFQLIVNPIDDPPTITQIGDQITDEDVSTAALPFLIADIDTSLTALKVTATSSDTSLVTQSGFVFVGSGANRTVQITPAANRNGITTITLTVSDDTSTDSITFQLTVNPILDPPTLTHIVDRSTSEGTATPQLSFTVQDVDVPLDSLTVTATSSDTDLVPNANLILGGSGSARSLKVIPAANLSGTVVITLTVSDGTLIAQDSFTLTVLPVDNPPTISHVNGQTISEDSSTNPIPFTVNDFDTPLDNLTVTASSSNPTLIPNGNLILAGGGVNRTIQATPIANAFGSTQVTISAFDGTTTVVETFQITVSAVNDRPVISDLLDRIINEDESTPSVTFVVSDVETTSNNLLVTATSSNQNLVSDGNLILSGTGSNRSLVAVPLAGQSGTTVITVIVNDGLLTATETFTLTVNSVNDPPTISVLANQNINEDNSSLPLEFTIGDVDTAIGSLVVTATSSNPALILDANLTLTGNGANRAIAVTPLPNQSGTATITITVNDGLAATSTSFDVIVAPVNDPPVITSIADQETEEDFQTPTISFSLSDVDNPAASLSVTASSSNIDLVPNSNLVLGGSGSGRSIAIIPATNQSGTTTITLTISDGATTTSESFVLTVVPVNNAPVLSFLADATILEDSATSPTFFNVSDIDSSVNSLIVTATSSNPALVPDSSIVITGTGDTRSFVVTPLANQAGTTRITLSVSDGGKTTAGSFLLTVTDVNDAPIISAISRQSINEDQATQSLPFVVGDIETDAQDLIVTASSSNPLLIPADNLTLDGSGSNRTITAVPLSNQFGLAIITVSVSDGTLTTTTSFAVVVNPVNDPPTITLGANQVIQEDAPQVVLTSWGTGISTGPANESNQTLSILVTTDKPELFSTQPSINSAGTLSYIVAPNANGLATITVRLQDDGGTASDGSDVNVQAFTISITAVKDPLTFYNSVPVQQYRPGSQPLIIDPQLGVHNVDHPNLDFSNGQLTVSVSGALKKDILSIPVAKKHKPAPGEISLVGTNVFDDTQQIGTLTGGKNGVPLRIQFGAGVSEAAVNALVKSLTFKTSGKQPASMTRTIHIELRDAANIEHAESLHTVQIHNGK